MIDVVDIAAADTHDLRRRVLRDGDPVAELEWPGDHDSSTIHLGVLGAEGSPIAVSTWLWRPSPLMPDDAAVQLRGMATDPAHRGTGMARAMLEAGLAPAAAGRIIVAWANARVRALGFYESHGWRAVGPVFATPETGIDHRLVTTTIGN